MQRVRSKNEAIKRSQSTVFTRQKSKNLLQNQSYLARSDLEMRKASKNHENQIQYDCRTNTIGYSAYQQSKKNNPLLLKLK